MIRFIAPALLLVASYCLTAQSDYATIKLDYGGYAVGFTRTKTIDSSRIYRRVQDFTNAIQFREVPISVWYPAAAEEGTRLLVEDYLAVLKEEEEWENLPDEFILDWFYYPRNEITEKNSRQSTQAFGNAAAANGRFPVIIYAPSYHASSSENFMLCEYLASHGYVVVAAPSRGSATMRLTGGNADDAVAQSRDLALLFAHAHQLPYTDTGRVFTIGFSFGGLANVPFAVTNRYVDGVISLDGTIKYNPQVAESVPGFDTETFRVPFVHFRQKEIPEVVLEQDDIDPGLAERFGFLDSIPGGPAYEFGSPSLTHGQFASYGLLFEPRDSRQDAPDSIIVRGYEQLNRAVLHTLTAMDAYADLGHWETAGYEGLITASGFTLKRAKRKLPDNSVTVSDFFDTVRADGFANIDHIYDAFSAAHPAFALGQGPLNTLGLQLGLASKNSQDEAARNGIAVLKLAVKLYPESANLHDSIATVYKHQGFRAEAIYHFERSLALNPENEYGRKQLGELKNN